MGTLERTGFTVFTSGKAWKNEVKPSDAVPKVKINFTWSSLDLPWKYRKLPLEKPVKSWQRPKNYQWKVQWKKLR